MHTAAVTKDLRGKAHVWGEGAIDPTPLPQRKTVLGLTPD